MHSIDLALNKWGGTIVAHQTDCGAVSSPGYKSRTSTASRELCQFLTGWVATTQFKYCGLASEWLQRYKSTKKLSLLYTMPNLKMIVFIDMITEESYITVDKITMNVSTSFRCQMEYFSRPGQISPEIEG